MFGKRIFLVSIMVVWFVVTPASALLEDWEEVVTLASPNFFATNVADGIYDVGNYGGEQTYEFIVQSNPDETEASMCLIGRRRCGNVTWAGLKYEQYENTGTYGATIFHVQDYDFFIPNAPGVDTHLVFVSSAITETCALYVNGVYQASVSTAIDLSGLVGIGYGAENDDLSGTFDNFDGVIYGAAIYDGILSDSEILAHSDAYFLPSREVMLSEMALFIMDEVDSGNIEPKLERSLLVKVNAAISALDKDNPNADTVAQNNLKALINHVEAQMDKKITPDAAATIIQRANAVIAALSG